LATGQGTAASRQKRETSGQKAKLMMMVIFITFLWEVNRD